MENQHRAIKGYRELNESEIEAMNEIKMKGAELGDLVEKLKSNTDLDLRWISIGATHLQQGLMALTRAVAKPTFFLWALVVITGCSSGFQETAFKDENGIYIVSRSLVNDRVTSNQPHVQGVFACDGKYSSEQMAERRADGAVHSWYTLCQPIEKYKAGAYQLTSDQPIGTLYQGPVSAAILGGSIGAGLALSGDTITQSSRPVTSSSASASASGGKAIVKGRH